MFYFPNGIALLSGWDNTVSNFLYRFKDGILSSRLIEVGALSSAVFPDPSNDQVVWASDANYGRLYKSSDGGSTWTSITKMNTGTEFTSDDLPISIAFSSPQEGMGLGSGGSVYSTSDGGLTWAKSQQQVIPLEIFSSGMNKFQLFDLKHGWYGCKYDLYRLSP